MTGIQRGISLATQVRDYLLDMIMEDQFAEGTIYSVSDLAAKLGVSRTPAREAVLQLQELGLLQTVKNKGFTVVAVTDHDVLEAFQLRHALEPIAARIAAKHSHDRPEIAERMQRHFDQMVSASESEDQALFMEHDMRFHDVLIENTGNSHLLRALKEARDATYRKGVFTRTHTRSWDVLNAEHELILTATRNGEVETAAQVMRDHIRVTGEHYFQKLGQEAPADWCLDY